MRCMETVFSTCSTVAALGWLLLVLAPRWHYFAFDLFIGSWEVRDAARHQVPHLLVVPCLILTFMLGPIGLLGYLGLRTWKAGTPVPDTV